MVHVRKWEPSARNARLERLFYPVAYALNRPALSGLGRLIYELALRCNGIGVNIDGSSGININEEKFIRRLAPSLQRGVVLDIGANAGGYAKHIRQVAPDATIYAFEPHPRTFAALQKQAALSRFEPIQAAMSDSAGEMTIYDFAGADGSTQASLDPAVIQLHGGGPVVGHAVQCTTLDAFVAARGIERIDLLKIDTEGFDLAVLRGATEVLRRRTAKVIQFEFIGSNIARRISMRDFFEMLEGYRIHRLCLNGALDPLDSYSTKHCEIFVRHNLIALPVA